MRICSHKIPHSKMSGVSTIDMVVVGTFLVISVCVVGCMFLLNCLYYKQRHGHQSTILAHTLGSRKPCGYNRSTSIVITASPYPVLNAGNRTTQSKQEQQVYPVAQTTSPSQPTAAAVAAPSLHQQEQVNFL